MKSLLSHALFPLTLQFFIAVIACAINERQQKALEYKTEEVLVLKDILKTSTGKNRIDFTEDQRRRLAVAGKELTIPHQAGIVPAPERQKKRTWKQFVRSHWHCLYASDLFDVEILGIFGAVRYSVFSVIELQTRTVEIAGIRVKPDGEWMQQVARNLTDSAERGSTRESAASSSDRHSDTMTR